MTKEEKAIAYDEALALMKDCIPDKDGYVCVRPCDIFQELKESEDEKIRKALIRFHKSTIDIDGIKGEDILAWLENQAPKPKWTEEDSLMIDSIIDTIKWLKGKGATDMKIDWLKSLKQRMEEQQ